MSTVTVIRCDRCKGELDERQRHFHVEIRGWWHGLEATESDFCSSTCLARWVDGKVPVEPAKEESA